MKEVKNNARVSCEKDGRFYNLHLTFKDLEGNDIKLIVKPLCQDKKTLSKLMYKIYKSLEE